MKSTQIDYVGGRYFYYLVQDTIAAGYHPVYINNFKFLYTLPYKRFKKLLLQDTFGIASRRSKYPKNSIYFSDQNVDRKGFSKTVRISFDAVLPKNANELQLPFAFFPTFLKQEEALLNLNNPPSRSKLIFFAGKASPQSHDKAQIREKYGLITRTAAILAIEAAIEEKRLPEEDIHLHYKKEDFISPAEWMPSMADSDFFLALPGVGMPLCHNLIEALAMGAIPILQYPQYMTPPLTDNVNCLRYQDAEDLIKVINTALQLSLADKRKLSDNAKNYYLKHLKLGQFTKQIVRLKTKNPVVYVNANRVPR